MKAGANNGGADCRPICQPPISLVRIAVGDGSRVFGPGTVQPTAVCRGIATRSVWVQSPDRVLLGLVAFIDESYNKTSTGMSCRSMSGERHTFENLTMIKAYK